MTPRIMGRTALLLLGTHRLWWTKICSISDAEFHCTVNSYGIHPLPFTRLFVRIFSKGAYYGRYFRSFSIKNSLMASSFKG